MPAKKRLRLPPPDVRKPPRTAFVPFELRCLPRYLQTPRAALAVLWVYISHADKNGMAWPSIETLVWKTGFEKKAVKRARARLLYWGFLKPYRQQRKGGKSGRAVFGRKPFQIDWGEIWDRSVMAAEADEEQRRRGWP